MALQVKFFVYFSEIFLKITGVVNVYLFFSQ